jgi:PAS domain-containing protein
MDNQPIKDGAPTCTERKALGVGLETVEREFLSLAENLPLNIARWDTEGRYLYINPTHERTLGRSASDDIGTVIPDSHNNVKAAIANVVATGRMAALNSLDRRQRVGCVNWPEEEADARHDLVANGR